MELRTSSRYRALSSQFGAILRRIEICSRCIHGLGWKGRRLETGDEDDNDDDHQRCYHYPHYHHYRHRHQHRRHPVLSDHLKYRDAPISAGKP